MSIEEAVCVLDIEDGLLLFDHINEDVFDFGLHFDGVIGQLQDNLRNIGFKDKKLGLNVALIGR